MNNLSNYIIEKLHINKDTKINNDIGKKIISIIQHYLISWTYLGTTGDAYKWTVKEISLNRIEIYIKGEARNAFWRRVGESITIKIERELHIKCEFSINTDDNKLYINYETS